MKEDHISDEKFFPHFRGGVSSKLISEAANTKPVLCRNWVRKGKTFPNISLFILLWLSWFKLDWSVHDWTATRS